MSNTNIPSIEMDEHRFKKLSKKLQKKLTKSLHPTLSLMLFRNLCLKHLALEIFMTLNALKMSSH